MDRRHGAQGYAYDGFGNLTSKIGAEATFSLQGIDAATNRLTGGSIVYDLNGNMTTDQNGAG